MNKWLLFLALILSIMAALATEEPSFLLGIEQFSPAMLERMVGNRNARVGLITNQSGKDQQGNRSIDLLIKKGIHITLLFAPEHGINGAISAGKKVENALDSATKLPIISLYTLHKNQDLSYTDNIDVLVFDIQDVGMRHYTYIATLLSALKVAAHQKIPFIVLDRPNPLGIIMEGPLPSLTNSFLASVPVPVRHAMTVGEIARYCNAHVINKPATLHVVKISNYQRNEELKKLIAPLSPNVQYIKACHGYSFLGLLGEIQPFDVGIGTQNAFQIIGLPHSFINKNQTKKLITLLQKSGIQSCPIEYNNARKNKKYRGIKITHVPINSFSACNTFLSILKFFKEEGVSLIFSKYFDAAAGNSALRGYIQGICTFEELRENINADLKTFYTKAQSAFIYEPKPKMVFIE